MSARSIRRARTRQDERKRSGAKLAAGAGAALGATVLFAPAAQAATFTVNTLEDSDDGDCFDDDCSLREAADEANADAAADTITFASGLTGTIELTDTDGDIPILAATTITGPGADVLTVSGEDTYRIFYVDAENVGDTYDPVTISGLTLANGYDNSEGGALYAFNTTLTLDGMALLNNESGSSGGALSTDDGNVFISNSRFIGNDAGSWGGALYLEDTEGTPEDDVEFRVTNSFFSANHTDNSGGAIDIDDPNGDSVVEGTTIVNNSADSSGAGITVNGTYEGGDVTVRNSTIAGNVAGTYGGGLYAGRVDGTLLVENTTISANRADDNGGGTSVDAFKDGEEVIVRNSTITGNVAGEDSDSGGGGIYLADSSNDADDNGPIDVSSTIVAGNAADFAPDLGQGEFAEGINVAFSLIGNPADAPITATGPNLTGVDPQLGPLADNGGPTQTHAPSFSSPVLDQGVGNGLATDQRGAPRTFDAANLANAAGGDGTDIGSVELLPGGRLSLAQCKGATENVLFAPGAAIVGTDANDVIVGTAGADQINAGKGNDLVCAAGGNDNAKGSGGKDRVFGEAGRDRLGGNGGKDKVKGGGGKDKIKGGGGKDRLAGQAGADTLKGGGGADRLKGGGGKDKLIGGPGRDKLNGGGGKDTERQ